MKPLVWALTGMLAAFLPCTLAVAPPAKAPRFLLAWGKKGDGPGEFHSPIGIAINARDEVFVSDLNNARVQKFSALGKHLGGFDLPRDDPKRKSTMVGGLAVDDRGHLYLAFMNQNKVAVYTEDGKRLREWGTKGKGDGEMIQAGGVLLGKDGNVFLADQGNHRIQKFTKEGKFLGKWGGHGVQPGQFGGKDTPGSRFAGPHWLAQDSKGRFYTTEAGMGRVQQLTTEGKPLLAWGDRGDGPGGFGAHRLPGINNTFGPIGVLVDRHDRVWVSSLNNRVQLFSPEGKYLLGLTGSGEEKGAFARPHGMAVDSKGHLYVCDAGNQRVVKFEVPDP